MRAVLLAGGKGTRLYPYTVTIPKPLAPIGEMGIMEVVLRQLVSAGCQHATVAVGHQAHLIQAYFGAGKRWGIQLDYSREETPLGTIGPLTRIADLPENFLVMNGDVLTDLNYRAFFDAHVRSGALGTIATYHRETLIDFGLLEYDDASHRITSFTEKPTKSFAVSMGVYAFNRAILDLLVPPEGPFGFDELVLASLRRNLDIRSYPHQGYWLDIGRPDDFDKANRDFESMRQHLLPKQEE